jgi:hypothetical protein
MAVRSRPFRAGAAMTSINHGLHPWLVNIALSGLVLPELQISKFVDQYSIFIKFLTNG